MSIDQDDDNIDDTGDHDHFAPAADPVLVALELARLAASPKTIATAIKKLRAIDRKFTDAQTKLAAVQAQAAELEAALVARDAACGERERALDAREVAFASQVADVRDELREQHNRLEQTNRQLIHRILSCSGLLAEWNPALQPLPSWQQLRQRIADLPPDLPTAPAAEVTQENVTQDWVGHSFVPNSTLSRSINKAAS